MSKAPTMEVFERISLLASDFDNTVALTSEPLPGGKTVEQAYKIAIHEVLGVNALARYIKAGGLRNRAPIEIVAELSPELESEDRLQMTDDLVEKKMEILLPQFGTRLPDGRLWPSPLEGMPETWSLLSRLTEVNLAVITSGHDLAVERFFDIHELAQPDITVTDDDMRPIASSLPGQMCVKPSRLLIDLAIQRWLEHHHLGSLVDQDYLAFSESMQRVFYVGDDRLKDGQMAMNAGVEFVQIDRDNPAPAWQSIGRRLAPKAFEGSRRV